MVTPANKRAKHALKRGCISGEKCAHPIAGGSRDARERNDSESTTGQTRRKGALDAGRRVRPRGDRARPRGQARRTLDQTGDRDRPVQGETRGSQAAAPGQGNHLSSNTRKCETRAGGGTVASQTISETGQSRARGAETRE